jgi:hypothetical protein
MSFLFRAEAAENLPRLLYATARSSLAPDVNQFGFKPSELRQKGTEHLFVFFVTFPAVVIVATEDTPAGLGTAAGPGRCDHYGRDDAGCEQFSIGLKYSSRGRVVDHIFDTLTKDWS